jgi:hypothetical protein
MALTRIEEVAWTEPSGAAPFNLKWIVTLALTLLVTGIAALLATRVITVESTRWLLRPFAALLNVVLFVVIMLATTLILQVVRLLMPLLQWLSDRISVEGLEENLQDLQEAAAPFPQDEVSSGSPFSPELLEALKAGLVVVVVLLVLWWVVRAFRRWQMDRYTTPGGVRESVDPDRTLAQDLSDFVKDQWRRLRGAADLRRLFQRYGMESARAIYASLLALLAAAGHPRRPEQTPYEYAPVAQGALPTRAADIAAITEAYVQAHYGEVEIGGEELTRLQEAWKRIKAEKKELLQAEALEPATNTEN